MRINKGFVLGIFLCCLFSVGSFAQELNAAGLG